MIGSQPVSGEEPLTQKIGPCALIRLEPTAERRCLGFGVDVHNASRFHTVVCGIDSYRDIFSLKLRLKRNEDLLVEPFLNLWA